MPLLILVSSSFATSIFAPGAAVLLRTPDDRHSTRRFLLVSDWFAPPAFTLASLVREIAILES